MKNSKSPWKKYEPENSKAEQPSYYNINFLVIEGQIYVLSMQQLEEVNRLREKESKPTVHPTHWMYVPPVPMED